MFSLFSYFFLSFFFFQAEDGIRDATVTGVQTCALPIFLSHQLWRRRFGSNPGIVSKTIALNAEIHQVIGVLPPDFMWNNRRTDVWVPYAKIGRASCRERVESSVGAGRSERKE